jgi:hypothetical protein
MIVADAHYIGIHLDIPVHRANIRPTAHFLKCKRITTV